MRSGPAAVRGDELIEHGDRLIERPLRDMFDPVVDGVQSAEPGDRVAVVRPERLHEHFQVLPLVVTDVDTRRSGRYTEGRHGTGSSEPRERYGSTGPWRSSFKHLPARYEPFHRPGPGAYGQT